MTSKQIQRIYKLGAVLNIVKNDDLHSLVYGLTGKTHVSQLDDSEFQAVERELVERVKISHLSPPPKRRKKCGSTRVTAGMTEGQQKKVWQLMYALAGRDQKPSSATVGVRLCGIIKRQFRMDVTAQQPFRWLNYRQGSQLIEILKGYNSSAERRTERENAQ
ncbi:MAG TPA: regulatory protein GemA [Ruminococcaceae bacterium]|nr:regulatory protein GemA [Oscillospiraceae bacterium]